MEKTAKEEIPKQLYEDFEGAKISFENIPFNCNGYHLDPLFVKIKKDNWAAYMDIYDTTDPEDDKILIGIYIDKQIQPCRSLETLPEAIEYIKSFLTPQKQNNEQGAN